MALPLRLPWTLAQDRWASQLNSVIQFAPTQGILLKNIPLVPGSNVINHLLSRQQQGWVITDQDTAAIIYRSAPLNASTLTLTSDIPVTIALWVF